MVHPDDLDAFGRITGDRTLTPEFEAEYGIWLKMHHRNNGQRGLGSLMIPLMRHMGIGPKADPLRTEDRINWAAIQPMTRVLAQTDTGPKMGHYVGLREYGILAVLYDGDPVVRQIEPFKLSLVAPDAEVDVVTPPPAEPERHFPEAGPPSPLTEVDEIPDFIPEVHDPPKPDGTAEPPKLENKEFYKTPTGSTVYVQNGPDTAEGKLVQIGPGDGEVTVWLEDGDEPQVFSEMDVLVTN